ncbi:hypothetical protein K435DRAFT_216926 [Dendrothele bispora CBS 962.96]|uniref:Uncharacterized protein n=1 Tax=Dendrothele bispora (strain CBS 962.96) TaxID=1314807 RepID=A0A4S8LRP3_DENBC|nr:hypothetical protein K435DRAFT_216926 [Dendrothele bispora CBS 962.96]
MPLASHLVSLGTRGSLPLSAGKEMYVFVMEGCIRVGVQGRDVVTVWKKDDEELRDEQVPKISKISKHLRPRLRPSLPPPLRPATTMPATRTPRPTGSAPSPMTIKLQAMLDSVRNRKRSSLVAGEPQPIQLPTLPALSPVDLSSDNEDDETMSIDSAPASIVPVLSVTTSAAVIVAVASAPCSPVTTSARLVPISSSSSDDEAESDTESDTESTTSSTSSTSSRFSSRSAESMTSVSSGGSNTAFGKPSSQPRLPESLDVRFPALLPSSTALSVTARSLAHLLPTTLTLSSLTLSPWSRLWNRTSPSTLSNSPK